MLKKEIERKTQLDGWCFAKDLDTINKILAFSFCCVMFLSTENKHMLVFRTQLNKVDKLV